MDPFNFDNSRPKNFNTNGVSLQDLVRPAAIKPRSGGIFGVLGDFLLDSIGVNDIIKERKLRSVMPNLVDNPDETIKAIAGFAPEIAQRLYGQRQDDQRLAAAQESTAEYRKSRTADSDRRDADRRRDVAARYINALPQDEEGRKAAWPTIRERILKMSPDDDYFKPSQMLPEEYDDVAIRSFAGTGATVAQQENIRLGTRRQDHKEEYDERRLDQYDRGYDQRDRALGQADTRIAQAADRFAASSARSGKAKPIMRYAGDDGYYHVEFDDGTVRRSSVKVRPTSKGSLLDKFRGGGKPTSKAPPVGYKNKYGLTFKGGDPNVRSNWK